MSEYTKRLNTGNYTNKQMKSLKTIALDSDKNLTDWLRSIADKELVVITAEEYKKLKGEE